MADAPPPRCETCGYDRAGLPAGALCPECGSVPPRSSGDPLAGFGSYEIGRVVIGLAMIALGALGGAISLVSSLLPVLASVLLGDGAGVVTALWVFFDLALFASVLLWSMGWLFAMRRPFHGEQVDTTALRWAVILASPLAIAAFATAMVGLLGDPAPIGALGAAVTIASLCFQAVVGASLLGELAARLGDTTARRTARQAASTISTSVLVIFVGLIPLAAVVPVLLILMSSAVVIVAILGPLISFILVLVIQGHRRLAASAMVRCVVAYEVRAGRAHWAASSGLMRALLVGSRHRTARLSSPG